MIQLSELNLSNYVGRQKESLKNDLISHSEAYDRRDHATTIHKLMENEQAAIELQLSNLILTYGAAAIKKELNKQTKIKKAV